MATRHPLLPLTLFNAGLVVLIAIVAISGARPTVAQPAPQSSALPSPARSFPPPANAPDPRIALVHDGDGPGGTDLGPAALTGIAKAAQGFDAEVKEVAGTPGDTDAQREQRLRELADARYSPIFVIGAANARAVASVAPDYPMTWFSTLDNGTVDEPNVVGILFHVEQGAFLAGAAAALMSKTGEVGFVGEVPDAQGQRYEAGFTAGARAVDPKTKVRVAYLWRSPGGPGRSDRAKARRVAGRMYDAGADVVFAAAGSSSGGVIRAAHDRGRWVIGADTDQYLASDASVRDAVLTSMLKRADVATYVITMEIATGVPKDGTNVIGVERDGVGYATSGGFVDAIREQLDALAVRIAGGEIMVPTTP